MTPATYAKYADVLDAQGFIATNPLRSQPNSFIKSDCEPGGPRRIFIHDDGVFRAYSQEEKLIGHGHAPWELLSLFVN